MRKLHGVSPDLIQTCACAVCEGVRTQEKRTPSLSELPKTKVVVQDQQELLQTIPGSLGFVPKDSIVVMGFSEEGLMLCTVRINILEANQLTDQVMRALSHNKVQSVAIAGIGDEEIDRDSAILTVEESAKETGLTVGATIYASNRDMAIPPASVFNHLMKTESLHHYGRGREEIETMYMPVNNEPFHLSEDERDILIAQITKDNARTEAERWRVIAVNTSNVDAYTLAGIAHYVNGNGLEAGFAFEQATQLTGDNPNNKLPQLLSFALSRGVPPGEIESVIQTLKNG